MLTLVAVRRYEQLFRVRRAVLSSTPAAAGVVAVERSSLPPTLGVALAAGITSAAAGAGITSASFTSPVAVPVPASSILLPGRPWGNSKCTTVTPAVALVDTSTNAVVPDVAAGVVVGYPSLRTELHLFISQATTDLHSSLLAPVWLDWVTRGVYVGLLPRLRTSLLVSGFCAGQSAAFASIPGSHVAANVAVLNQQQALLPLESELRVEVSATPAERAVLEVTMDPRLASAVVWSNYVTSPMPSPCVVAQFDAATACAVSGQRTSCHGAPTVLTLADLTASIEQAVQSVLALRRGAYAVHPDALVVDAASGASQFSRWLVGVLGTVRQYTSLPLRTLTVAQLGDIEAASQARAVCDADVKLVLDQVGESMGVRVGAASGCTVPLHGVRAAAGTALTDNTSPIPDAVPPTLAPGGMSVGSDGSGSSSGDDAVPLLWVAGVSASEDVVVATGITPMASDCVTNMLDIDFVVGTSSFVEVQAVHPLDGRRWDVATLSVRLRIAAGNSSAVLENVASMKALPRSVHSDFTVYVACCSDVASGTHMQPVGVVVGVVARPAGTTISWRSTRATACTKQRWFPHTLAITSWLWRLTACPSPARPSASTRNIPGGPASPSRCSCLPCSPCWSMPPSCAVPSACCVAATVATASMPPAPTQLST